MANRRAMILGSVLVVALSAAVICIQAIWRPLAPRAHVAASVAQVDIDRPDALVVTAHLSSLPRDLLRVPLLHDVLSEDFVDYYEHNEARLSLAGSLRRIAYEHDLDWGDRIIRSALDEPAELAAWRTPNGRLGYWMLVLRRNGLHRMLQGIANVVLSDAQLKKVGMLSVDHDDVPLYAFAYGYQRTLLFATHGDRMAVLSDPGMLLDESGAVDDERSDTVAKLLADSDAPHWTKSPLGKGLGELAAVQGHHVMLATGVLAFGYQAFFPGLEAVRFDLGPDGQAQWQSLALVDPRWLPDAWDSHGVWHAVPTGAAACASLPVFWPAAGRMLEAIAGKKDADALLPAFAGPTAVCWYSRSRLYAPLFVTRLKRSDLAAAMKPQLAALFGQFIGAHEVKVPGPDGRLPVLARGGAADASVWQRDVSARGGSAEAAQSAHATQLSADRYFPVTLAISHDTLVFSPDGRLVDDALAVLAKNYPAMADGMGADGARTFAQLTPAALAKLAEDESFASLPQDDEPVFRNAANTYLLPKLHALARYPGFSLQLPAALPRERGWVPVSWQPLPGAATTPAH